MNNSPECIICSREAVIAYGVQTIIGKYQTRLLACQHCHHQWFENPSIWLAEAYSSPIANTDTGIVSRSLHIHRCVSAFLGLSPRTGKVLDWGSGSGLLTRLLRDDGHDCYGLEPYTPSVLAGCFTWKKQVDAFAQGPYRAIIAIEVVEHLVNPQEFFSTALSNTDTLIFSTELLDSARNGEDWWYYSRETGQHITFYTEASLACLAHLNGCKYAFSRDERLHIITRQPADIRLFGWLCGQRRAQLTYPLAQILGKLRGRRSLAMADHLAAKQALCSAQAKSSE
jgi:Methyltransferase domain